MASGHVNRIKRPNTWLHRPACGREESPCQLGAVHTWHEADMSRQVAYVRRGDRMNRRAFITLIAGAATWPLAARAQQPAKLPTIGYLGSGTRATQGEWAAAFVQRLRELGWIDARTVAIEYRWAQGRDERAAEIAAEFVRRKVDVIVTSATPLVAAAKQATSVIP